jgi:hypothetical protein
MKPWWVLHIAAFGLAGCAAHDTARPTDVRSALAAGDGQQIQIRGFLRYGDDARGLWQSAAAYRGFAPNAAPVCITLWNAGAFRERLLRRDQSIVTLIGKLHVEPPLKADEIALGRCNDVGLIIERIR